MPDKCDTINFTGDTTSEATNHRHPPEMRERVMAFGTRKGKS